MKQKPIPPLKAKAKILMLHGHAQSGSFFLAKTRFLHESLRDTVSAALFGNHRPSFPGGIELCYPTGLLPVKSPDYHTCAAVEWEENEDEEDERFLIDDEEIDMWAWGHGDHDAEITGLEQSVRYILELLDKQGPFIGVIGFSTGATLAAIIASLLEGNRSVEGFQLEINHPPLYFAVCFSGFMLSHKQYKPLYYPKIQTPTLHVIGSLDTWTPQSRTMKLAKRCNQSRIVYFSGTHFVPRGREVVKFLMGFLREALGWKDTEESSESDWIDI
ncbi:serine hydrolase FSH [Xylogone sp. PMI_703]|nr:serine hydrolase FSH [Xylogone sp. PMI_703]